MAYRFYPASHNKKVAPAPMPLVLNTKSLSAFPALGSGSSGSGSGSGSSGSGSASSASLPAPASGEKKIQMPVKLDYKKTAIMAPPSAVELEKMMAASSSDKAKVTPSSMIPTRCYDEFGEDYDGPDEWEMEREAEEFQLNAALPVGGRRGGF